MASARYRGRIIVNDTDYTGSFVDPNPSGVATDDLNTVGIDGKIFNIAGSGGGSDVEPNPSGTPTDTLETLGIDGTVYEIQGGGGGVGGSSVYSEKVLYKASDNTFTNIQVDFTKDYDVYVFYCNDVITQKSESYYYVKSEIEEAIKDNILISMYPYGSEGYCQYNISNSGLTTLTNRAGFFIYKIVGLKFGTLSPIIYSTEEREVGVWIDNKPLYAKSFTFSSQLTVSASSWTNTDLSLSNVEKFVNGYAISDDGTFQGSVVVDKSNDVIQLQSTRSSASYVKYLTVFYTKTTDVAGSAQYNTLGVPAHHYDDNEKVVGTWFGKTLYEKTLVIHNESTVSSTTTITTIDSTFRVKNWKAFAIEYGVNYQIPYVAGSGSASFYFRENGNVDFTITNTSFAAGSDFYITIEYTKTTD